MGRAVGDILPFAVGVAISPVPIIAVILMLFSGRAAVNGPAFLAGWVLGLGAVVLVVALLAGAGGVGDGSGGSDVAGVVKLLLGALLLLLAVRQWNTRPPPGTPAPVPGWMRTIDSFTPVRSAAVGALLSGVNPKNLTLAVGAALSVVQGDLSGGGTFLALALFVVIGSVGIAVPVGYVRFGGARATATLTSWKTWMTDNNATVMTVLFVVMGAALVGKGIASF